MDGPLSIDHERVDEGWLTPTAAGLEPPRWHLLSDLVVSRSFPGPGGQHVHDDANERRQPIRRFGWIVLAVAIVIVVLVLAGIRPS